VSAELLQRGGGHVVHPHVQSLQHNLSEETKERKKSGDVGKEEDAGPTPMSVNKNEK
jgi:hypothetical protein